MSFAASVSLSELSLSFFSSSSSLESISPSSSSSSSLIGVTSISVAIFLTWHQSDSQNAKRVKHTRCSKSLKAHCQTDRNTLKHVSRSRTHTSSPLKPTNSTRMLCYSYQQNRGVILCTSGNRYFTTTRWYCPYE